MGLIALAQSVQIGFVTLAIVLAEAFSMASMCSPVSSTRSIIDVFFGLEREAPSFSEAAAASDGLSVNSIIDNVGTSLCSGLQLMFTACVILGATVLASS